MMDGNYEADMAIDNRQKVIAAEVAASDKANSKPVADVEGGEKGLQSGQGVCIDSANGVRSGSSTDAAANAGGDNEMMTQEDSAKDVRSGSSAEVSTHAEACNEMMTQEDLAIMDVDEFATQGWRDGDFLSADLSRRSWCAHSGKTILQRKCGLAKLMLDECNSERRVKARQLLCEIEGGTTELSKIADKLRQDVAEYNGLLNKLPGHIVDLKFVNELGLD